MVKMTGRREHLARLRRATGPEGRNLINQALYAGGQMIELDAEQSITEGSVSGKGHVPSRPGEPPNADTRQLDTSIHTVAHPADLRVQVIADAPHAVPLETGTSKMAARPYMRPAAERNRPKVIDLVRRAVDKATRK